MLKTRITEMLGIEYPILMGGMQWLTRAELVAAMADAGGLGFITAATFRSKDELRDEIRKAKDLTDKPFGVNVSMLPAMTMQDMSEQYFEVIVDEGVPVVETSGRSPEPYVPTLKAGGVKIIHKVPAARYARTAERVGADAVTIVGFECGGHPGMDDVATLVSLPHTADTVKIPVVAAGGFCDGRGLVAALTLGADAILMGTRFLATRECAVHPSFKEWMVHANVTDTMIIERSIRNAARVIRNEAAEKVLEMEQQGASLEELMQIISGQVGKSAMETGDIQAGTVACGQVVGRIQEIATIKEVIDGIVSEAEEVLKRLNDLR